MGGNVITIGNRQFEVTSGDGSAMSDADRTAAALQFMKQQQVVQPPPPPQPGIGQQISQGIGAVKQWATAPPDPNARDITGFSRDNPVANTIRSIGSAVLPGSAPELATQAALMAVPGGFLTRTGAAMAAGGGTAALTGESVPAEAAKAGVASTLGTVATKALGAAGNYLANRVNPEILDTVRGLWTKTLGRAIDQDVPAFAGKVRSPQDLLQLRDQGKPILRGLYRSFEDDTRGSRITMPYDMALKSGVVSPPPPPPAPLPATGLVDSFGRAAAAPVAPPPPPPAVVSVPIERVFPRLLELKALAREADPGTLGFEARETARQFEDTFVRSLTADNAGTYSHITQQFNKGLGLLSALRNSQMFGQSGASQTPLEPANLTRWAAQNIEDFSPRQFPNIWQALSRGGQLGTTDVTSSSGSARLYSPFEGKLPVRVSEALPRFETMQQAGGAPVNPSLTAQGLQAAGSQTGQRGASAAAVPSAVEMAAGLRALFQSLVGHSRNQ